jgi:hypothetical protein
MECAVPLFAIHGEDDAPALLGTSTLVDLDGRLLLVTAKHLFDGLDCRKLAFPSNPLKSDIWTLGNVERIEPLEEHLDAAVLVVMSEQTASILRAGWRPVTLSAVAAPSASGDFVLSGFPADLTSNTPEYLRGKMLSIYTDRLPAVPGNADSPVLPSIDLFFLCDDSSVTLDGKPQELPRLQGTSGAGVWQVVAPPPGELWTAERALRLVGVQATYRKGQYFRAKSWTLVAQVLQESDLPDLVSAGRDLELRLAPPGG